MAVGPDTEPADTVATEPVPGDERGTVVERPVRSEPAPPSEPAPASESSVSANATTANARASSSLISRTSPSGATARGALDLSEVRRTRNFCFVGLGIAAAGAIAVPQLPGGVVTTRVFLAGIGCAIAGLLYLLYRARTPETFHQGVGASIGWFIPIVAVTTAVPFFGAMSPAPILLVLGIFFNGLGGTRGVAVATYVSCAVVQGTTGALVGLRVMDDPGFIRPDGLAQKYELMCQVLIQFVLLGTFIIARASRRSSLAALSELEQAVRAVAQREALLDEARAELKRALGSARGRFTEQLIGNYQLGDLIGHGAMGEVYQGVDTRDNQPVAVKMLSRTSLGNTQHVERFLRELQTTTAITSPHVVRVLAIGEDPLPHLVMERLRGRDLSAMLKSRGTLEPEVVIDLVRQVAEGLAAAAAAGIVHRDIKPQNLFQAGPTWKILDFGVARILATTDTLTAGNVVGTPAYMAPEQARGGKVDQRTDVYALAAVSYRALTGHPLFRSENIADTLYQVAHTPPHRPSRRAALKADIDAALAIGLAKRPDDRFATAQELAAAIEAALTTGVSPALRQRAARIANAWQGEDG
jgi:eukaryotic-like serine/threonine-protein kinase